MTAVTQMTAVAQMAGLVQCLQERWQQVLGVLVAAIVAKLTGQPYGVWYGLGLPGCIGIFVMGFNFPVVRRVYTNAEMRRLQAEDV